MFEPTLGGSSILLVTLDETSFVDTQELIIKNTAMAKNAIVKGCLIILEYKNYSCDSLSTSSIAD